MLEDKGMRIIFLAIFLMCNVLLHSDVLADEKNNIVINTDGKATGKETSYGQCKECNLIMISINNIGAEHMSLYGYKRQTTPNLDKWSKEALVFTQVFSPASWTLPVATSLFTSLYPYTHTVMNRYSKNLLNKDIITFPQILENNQYATAAFTGGLDYAKTFGHMRGFEITDDNAPFTGFNVTLRQATAWINANSQSKFFLFIHGYNAHPPYTPSSKFRGIFSRREGKNITVDNRICVRGYKKSANDNEYIGYYVKSGKRDSNNDESRNSDKLLGAETKQRSILLTKDDIDYLRDLYDEEILEVDSMVVNFLNSLDKNLLNKTVIVILSEHGEMFAKHGRFGRAGAIRGTLYDDVTRVPLIIKMPHGKYGKVNALTQVIDIMPTMLDILGIPFLLKIQGKSLLSLINGNKPINEYVYAGSEYNIGRPAPFPFYHIKSKNEYIRDDRWKLIHEVNLYDSWEKQGNEEALELYDIENDPQELTSLSSKYPDIVIDLKMKLTKWRASAEDFLLNQSSSFDIPSALIEEARKHGYW